MNVVHCKREPYDVYIGRGSKWGNPFTHLPLNQTKAKVKCETRAESISMYRTWLRASLEDGSITLQELAQLDGKVLGCWCSPKPCHGDVLRDGAAYAAQLLADEHNPFEGISIDETGHMREA